MPPEDNQPAPVETSGRQLSRQPYRGPIRVRRSDGRRERWVEGHGYVPESASVLAPEAQDAISAARSRVQQATGNASLGHQFLQHNSRQPSGGWVERLPLGMNTIGRPDSQAMEGLTSQMLRSNIQPGTSGTMNSEKEMALALAQYPSLQTSGPVNRTRVLRLNIDRDIAAARLQALETYARQRGNVDGFEQTWAQTEPQLRASIEARYASTNGPIDQQADQYGRQRPNPVGNGVGAFAARQLPRPGTIEEGYRFRGGNPGDRNNWEPVR